MFYDVQHYAPPSILQSAYNYLPRNSLLTVTRASGAINDPNSPYYLTPMTQAIIFVSGALSAYHGYKRNHESFGWGIGWGVLGAMFPMITIIVAIAQGFAKPSR